MKLAQIFTSNLVFAVEKPIRVFGTGKGIAEIVFRGEKRRVESDGGNWMVEFAPLSYGGPYELTATLNGETKTLENVYVGDVYMLAGQSNLQFKLKESTTSETEWESNEKIRLFTVDRPEKGERFQTADGWVVSEKKDVGDWSAVGYISAREIYRKKGVAVGLIACYQGASIIESWLPEGTCQTLGISIPVKEKYFDHWYEDYHWNKDGFLYQHSLSKVTPFSLNAVVWYQGESDADGVESTVYGKELEALISVMRNDFQNQALPFVIVQLADCDERAGEGWKNVQNAQWEMQYKVKNVKSVRSKDVCETNDIHPPTKEKLAIRVADALQELWK